MADPFSLRAHAVNVVSSSASQVTCQIFGAQPGDLLTAQICFPYDSSFDGVIAPILDSVNNSPWAFSTAAFRNTTTNMMLLMLHFINSMAGNPTLTINMQTSAVPLALFLQAWDPYGASVGLSQGPAGNRGTSTNPTSGAITPNVGELVIGIVQEGSVTPTPGAGYSQIDSDVASTKSWVESLIQGSATAATWVASSDSWAAQVATYTGTFDPQTPIRMNYPDRRYQVRGY